MALTGKILAALNLVAVLLIVCVASADWAQRRAWGYALFREELTLDGLPLDDQEWDAVEGVPRVQRIGPETLRAMFQNLGEPVKTQPEEVVRLHGTLRASIEGAGREADQRRKLSEVLLPLARTGKQREILEDKLRTQDLKTLLGSNGPFERVFRAISDREIVGPEPARLGEAAVVDPFAWAFLDLPEGSGNKWDPGEHRRAIAHLLFNLPDSDEPPARAAVIVGLRAYTEEGNRQAIALSGIASGAAARLKSAMAADRAAFVQRYDRIILDLQMLDHRVADRGVDVTRAKELFEKHRLLVEGRQSELAKLQSQLRDSQEVTRKALDELAHEQRLLFEAHREVRQGQMKNAQLERELRRVEHIDSPGGRAP